MKQPLKKIIFIFLLGLFTLLGCLLCLGGYLYSAKHFWLRPAPFLFRVPFIQHYLVDKHFEELKKLSDTQEIMKFLNVFPAVWETNQSMLMSRNEFRPVTMYEQSRYLYQPNLKKITFWIYTPKGPQIMEMRDSPELRALLSKMNVGKPQEVSFDSYGFRKTEFPYSEHCGATVLFAGDSYTEGLWVGDHETFANQYGHLTNRQSAAPVCIVNTGVNGYGTLEESYIIENYYETFHPQVIFLMHFPNDIDHFIGTVFSGKAKYLAKEWEDDFFYLRKIKNFCEARGIRLLLGIIPQKDQFNRPETRKNYQDKLIAFCQKEGISFVDFYDEFKRLGPKKIYQQWEQHFEPYGHQIVAQILWEKTKDFFKKNASI